MSGSSVSFAVQIVSANNLYPLEDMAIAVHWKGKKGRQQGATAAAVVKQHKVAFANERFEMLGELTPAKKKGAAPSRIPLVLTIEQVLSGKKTKEVASCEMNLADYAEKKAQPYAIRLKFNWSIKIPKAFEAALAQAAGDIILRIDPTEIPAVAASTPSTARIPASTPAAVESKSTPSSNPFGDAPAPAKPAGAGAAKVAPTNPFGDASVVSVQSSILNDNSRDSEDANVKSRGSVDRERSTDGEQPAGLDGQHATHARQGSSASNPFASLSRKVGGTSEQTYASSLSLNPAPSPRLSVTSASIPDDDKNSEKDARKLRAEVQRLKQDMERLEQKRAAEAKKVIELQSKVKQLEKVVPKGSMKELRRDGYQPSSVSEAALVGSSADGGIVPDSIIQLVRGAVADAERVGDAVHWLSWGCALHGILTRGSGAAVASIAEHGIDTKRPVGKDPAALGSSTSSGFVANLETVIEEAYQRCLRVVEAEIRFLVEKKARNYWDVEVESAALGVEVVDLFEKWVTNMINMRVPYSVLNQWLFQTLYSLSASIFNSFLAHPPLCDPSVALQIKVYLSELENWGSGHASVLYQWRSFKVQLQPLVDLSNVLLVDKKNLSPSMLKEAAPSLSLPQVKCLLDFFGETAKEQERVPKAVAKEISDACGMERVPIEKAMIREKLFDLHDLVSAKPSAH